MAFNKKEYDRKYSDEHYSRIVMDIPKDLKIQIVEHAKQKNMKITPFIMECVKKYIGEETTNSIGNINQSGIGNQIHINQQ